MKILPASLQFKDDTRAASLPNVPAKRSDHCFNVRKDNASSRGNRKDCFKNTAVLRLHIIYGSAAYHSMQALFDSIMHQNWAAECHSKYCITEMSLRIRLPESCTKDNSLQSKIDFPLFLSTFPPFTYPSPPIYPLFTPPPKAHFDLTHPVLLWENCSHEVFPKPLSRPPVRISTL